MQTYDMLMAAVLAAATIFGFWKGLAWQVASIASLVASYIIALRFGGQLAPMISEHSPWNKFVAMLIIYVAASLAIWTIFRLVAGVIDRVRLKEFDRQMGALIGFAKGVLFCIAITFFAVTILSQDKRERIIASRSGQYIVRILDKAGAVAPPEIKEVIGPYIQRIEQRMDPEYRPDPQNDVEKIRDLWQQQAARDRVAAEAESGFGEVAASVADAVLGDPNRSPNEISWPTNDPARANGQTPAWPISTGQFSADQ